MITNDSPRFEVLGNGYIRLVDIYGSDLHVVNAARASFRKESLAMCDDDRRLLWYLARKNELAPFRHVSIHIEVKAPLMVARQWWKYIVGSDHTMEGWSEASRRYVTLDVDFYEPKEFREAAKNKKQGSAGVHPDSDQWRAILHELQQNGKELFDQAVDEGMAPEMARGFLPSDFQFVTWRATHSLQSLWHLVGERDAEGAQWEFRQYAKTLRQIGAKQFPEAWAALEKARKQREIAMRLFDEWEKNNPDWSTRGNV